MKMIKVEIEITNIESWDINWADERSAENELAELDNEIQAAVARNCGIGFSHVKVKSKTNER